jgi:hypothetical protein
MNVNINSQRNIPGRGEFMLRRKINSMAMFAPDTPLLPAGLSACLSREGFPLRDRSTRQSGVVKS